MTLTTSQTKSDRYILSDRNMFLDQSEDYVLCVKDLPDQEKPREKMQEVGSRNLSVVELMAILLETGTKKEEVMTMSHRIISEYGEKAIFHETDPTKLAQILDIPLSKASKIIVAFELGRRFYAKKQGKPIFIRNSSQAYEYLKNMAFSHKEQLRGLYLNSRHELVHDEVISVGSLTANIVHPREVFRPALVHNAVAIIIAHNHPSGDLDPTPPDKLVTKQLRSAGENMGIGLLDHLIISEKGYHSIVLKEHLL